MRTTVVTSATGEPITLEAFKDHLNVPIGYTEDDDYLESLISVSRSWAEEVTWRKFMTQTVDYYFDEFPSGDQIELPYGELQSVTSVTYTNSTNQTQTFSTGSYSVDTVSTLGRIVLNSTASWPSDTLHPTNPIKIRFVCGYGSSSAVPVPLRHVIKFQGANLYEHREPTMVPFTNIGLQNVPKGLDALLANYRLKGF